MESSAESGAGRNDVLSQSYAEYVERAAQQKNDDGLSFDLPKEVLEERRKVWDNFFDKYADEASDEVELDLNTMKPVGAEDEEENSNEENDEEEDEAKEYYSKCRAPLRKLPALIQYWIDTGNPPYQLGGDDDHSETGSSLSEGEHSRSGHSAVLRESSDKHKSNTSRCSSVDTAAYILSNTNITKKADTMAIVEGAKTSDENMVSKAPPLKEILAESVRITNNAIIHSPNHGEKSPDEIARAATPIASKIAPEFEKSLMTTPFNAPRSKHSDLPASKPLEALSPSQQSVKLSEILPELQEFDEMLKRSNATGPPKTRLSLAEVRQKPKRDQSADAVVDASQSSQTSIVPNGQKKLQNRRRLYKGRDSPVDLVVERPNGGVVHAARLSLHPALESAISQDDKAKRLEARARTRRKRKRASHISEINSQDGNTTTGSDQPIGEANSKGDERYTNFFESLGLTPSQMVRKARVRRRTAKRSKFIARQVLPRVAKNVAPVNDSIESSDEESENTSHSEDSTFSPVGKAQDSGKNSTALAPGGKIVSVRIERLPDEWLARYSRKVTSESTRNKEFKANNSQICATSSGSSSGKKERRSNLEKIELLTTLTHDSDSSTILICSCKENDEQCDSDDILYSKNVSQTKKMSLTTRGCKPTKAVSDSVKSEFTEHLDDKLLDAVVKLEKLELNNLKKAANNSRKKRKSEVSIARKDSKMIFKTYISPQSERAKSPVRNEKKIDLFGDNASEGVTIGSRIFRASNSGQSAVKSRRKVLRTRTHCILGISIPSDEEEDNFVKLVSAIGSKRDSTKLEETYQEKNRINDGNKTQNLSNGDGRIRMERSQKFFPISTSSDEEDVYVEKSKRRTRNFHSRNDETRGERRKTEVDRGKKVKNRDEAIKLNNRLDESNRRKFPSEKAAKAEVAVNGETRRSQGRSKSTNDTFSASKDEAKMKIDDGETRGSNDVRRSRRRNLFASSSPKNQVSTKKPFAKPKDTKNLFAASQESGITDVGVLPAWWDNRDLGLTDENFMSEKSKSRMKVHAGRDDKRIVGTSMRFQTRLNSDSDSEFEGLRFLRNDRSIQRSPKAQSNEEEIAKSNRPAVALENKPEIDETVTIGTSPRRTFKSLTERRRKIGERTLPERGRNLFKDELKSTEKCVNFFDNDAMDVEACWNNGLPLLDDFPTKATKDSSEKSRKTRPKLKFQEARRSRKNSTKSDRSKNRSPVANHRNGESRVSPSTKRKKLRRIRILGNPMDWESEDDTDSNENNVESSKAKQGKRLGSLTNGDSCKKLSDKDASENRESSTRQQEATKSLFSSNLDDTVDDFDLLFSGNSQSRSSNNGVVIDKLNFTSAKKYKNLSYVGQSTMTFRTRLNSDTDDDEES